MDYVQCNGSESSLAQCTFDGWGANFCGHYRDVSVTCQPCKYTKENFEKGIVYMTCFPSLLLQPHSPHHFIPSDL